MSMCLWFFVYVGLECLLVHWTLQLMEYHSHLNCFFLSEWRWMYSPAAHCVSGKNSPSSYKGICIHTFWCVSVRSHWADAKWCKPLHLVHIVESVMLTLLCETFYDINIFKRNYDYFLNFSWKCLHFQRHKPKTCFASNLFFVALPLTWIQRLCIPAQSNTYIFLPHIQWAAVTLPSYRSFWLNVYWQHHQCTCIRIHTRTRMLTYIVHRQTYT